MPTSKTSLDFKLIAVRVLPGCVQHIRKCLVENHFFMFGLLESCKLNKVNFGEYIEDILTRILCGEEVDASFLPCDYVRHFEDGMDAEVTKTSQAVA